jgi:Domain of unknown function (DUF3943)
MPPRRLPSVMFCILLLAALAPPARLMEAQAAAPEPPAPPPEKPKELSLGLAKQPKRFWTAAGEVALLEVLPWAFSRYVTDEDFARISWHTVSENWHTGFVYDHDDFNTNQFAHPYHGSLYFDAARSNGFTFWESGAFTLAGSLLWECCMENTAPSINDLINTTLGGMTRGEISHRLSVMILDNTASGGERFWRELGAALVNPVGAFTRLVHGDMSRDFPNPEERFPSGFSISTDLGYRHVQGGGVAHSSQALFSFSALYGDPFNGDIRKPFDTFWVGFDATFPGGTALSRFEERGLLKGWELGDPASSIRHVFGISQEYEYINNASQVFGAEMFGAGLLSRYDIREGVRAVTDLSAIAIPLAGIQTIDFASPDTGRNYDYAPGGGLRVAARLYAGAREVIAAGYGIVWARTVDGVSRNNTLQFLRVTGRIPIWGPLGVGGGYWWYSRKTTYTGFFERQKTQSEWRAFLNFAIGGSQLRPRTG